MTLEIGKLTARANQMRSGEDADKMKAELTKLRSELSDSLKIIGDLQSELQSRAAAAAAEARATDSKLTDLNSQPEIATLNAHLAAATDQITQLGSENTALRETFSDLLDVLRRTTGPSAFKSLQKITQILEQVVSPTSGEPSPTQTPNLNTPPVPDSLATIGSQSEASVLTVENFISSVTERVEGSATAGKDLYNLYTAWIGNGVRPLTREMFEAELIELGYQAIKAGGRVRYMDIALKDKASIQEVSNRHSSIAAPETVHEAKKKEHESPKSGGSALSAMTNVVINRIWRKK